MTASIIPVASCRETDSQKPKSESYFNIKLADTLDPFFVRKIPAWKRAMDVVGSIVGLILFGPIFLLIFLVIKCVSPGPVFFKQERIGYGGKRFNFLKFRTMIPNSDPSTHHKYYCELINSCKDQNGSEQPMIKLDDENSQIIPFGKILRKTYIDELPQLINVLRGEMSLVGPRPPIRYEVKEYLKWHSGRFDAVPGMTGLWQVSGKNRLSFKEMVRLDIRYSRKMSILLDFKILLLTPFAIARELMYSR